MPVREVVIYIHGVDQRREGGSHDASYQSFHRAVAGYMSNAQRVAWPSSYVGVEWGWQRSPQPDPSELLTSAQRALGDRLEQTIRSTSDFSLNPARIVLDWLRPLALYGFADMFYYVSRDGKNSIRAAVAQQILTGIQPSDADPLSLTFVTHSAGSVVAFDLLYYLFAGEEHIFLEAQPDPSDPMLVGLRALRDRAQRAPSAGLRVRRLITLGSPISMLAYRSNAVVALLAAQQRIDPALHGLTQNPPDMGPPLSDPRWLNFWDRDDAIAYPVEPLMQPSPAVRDVYVDVSDNLSAAHSEYWTSPLVLQEIAQGW